MKKKMSFGPYNHLDAAMLFVFGAGCVLVSLTQKATGEPVPIGVWAVISLTFLSAVLLSPIAAFDRRKCAEGEARRKRLTEA